MAWLHKTHLPSNNKRGCFFKASFSVIFMVVQKYNMDQRLIRIFLVIKKIRINQ